MPYRYAKYYLGQRMDQPFDFIDYRVPENWYLAG